MADSICTELVSEIAELIVSELPLSRGGRVLQPALTFSLSAGEFLSVHGPNGAGKTSLLRAIAGLLEVPHGSIVFRLSHAGIIANSEERLPKIGWFGHQEGVKRQLSVYENTKFFGQYNHSEANIEEALDALGLIEVRDILAQFLSHGQRRRLAFARLLVVSRPLWLLDEPMTSLDEKAKHCVRAQIVRHCRRGGIVVAASHEELGINGASIDLA